ncbi:MAG: pentapeptide repeat-containing protein [Pseudomonadota bacterium]
MAKDPILAEKFFSNDPGNNQAIKNEETLDLLIKRKLYPNLSADMNPVYYQGSHALYELIAFIDKPEYTILQQELALTLEKIKSWGEHHDIEGTETLITFKQKLVTPSDSVTLLYADGKKFLETIAVLLEDAQISLQNRKTILTNLLADKELEKCINGCYSRIANAAAHLQESLEGNQNVQHWIRSFVTDKARKVATQRPFAMPDSYQGLLCKASDCSELQHGLHANNYLALEAKKHGFPIDNALDQGAIELGRGIAKDIKATIVARYITQLEKEITAKNLVNFLSDKLHENFQDVMSSDLDYTDKMDKIVNKLNILGEDPWFTSKKVGLNEIISEEGRLKASEYLKITVTERLIQRGLLNAESIQTLKLGSEALPYRRFSAAIELTWFLVDGERKPFLSMFEEERFYERNYFQPKYSRIVTSNSFSYSSFIRSTEDLLLVVKNSPKKEFESFLVWVSMGHAVSLIKTSDSPKLFVELLSSLADKNEKALFLRSCGDQFIHNRLSEGIFRADFTMQFPELKLDYVTDNSYFVARQEGLSITKALITELIGSGFINFNGFNFYEVRHLAYLDGISFSKLSLKDASFFQSMKFVLFDEAELTGTKFWRSLSYVSFENTDLRSTMFWTLVGAKYSSLSLQGALLSTQSFNNLRSAHVLDFTGADLRAVDFQQPNIKNRLQDLDFSKANLAGVDLSKFDMKNLKLLGANLANTNLRGSDLCVTDINAETNFKRSQLSLVSLVALYEKGIKIFDRCKIAIDSKTYKYPDPIIFHETSFKKAHFIGPAFKVNFIESDLTEAIFSPSVASLALADTEESVMHLSIQAKKSSLDKTTFRNVKFFEEVEFSASSLKNIVFNRVEMDSALLFVFYELGNRNFKGVNDLKGEIPKKLLPFPVLDAELNKQTFLHLYRKGLRDFRGSNLNSFYLGQVLIEQVISEIDLKLEGALYKPFALGCGLRQKRARGFTNTDATCAVYFLFQSKKNVDKRLILKGGIDSIARSEEQRRFVVREHVLGTKALFTLEQQVTQVNFYWGYRPEESDLTNALIFTRESVAYSVRSRLSVNYRIYQRYPDHTVLTTFSQSLHMDGFRDITVNYYCQGYQACLILLKNGVSSIETKSHLRLDLEFRKILDNVKISPRNPTLLKNENYRARLRRIGMEVRLKTGQGFRAGVRQGAHYEIGAGVVHIISQWLANRGSESKNVDAETQKALALLARKVTFEVGEERGASERQMEIVLHVTKQCIARGECSNADLVIKDVMDSMYRIRSDLMIGNGYIWKKIKEFFTNIGVYLSDKFDDLNKFFNQSINWSLIHRNHHRWAPPIGLFPLRRRTEKRNIVTWYESPLLVRLIREIEAGFEALDYNLQLDSSFTEEELVGFLYDLWQALASRGITASSSHESILSLLESSEFTEQAFNISLENSFFIEPPFVELPVNASQPAGSSRQKRAVNVKVEQDIPQTPHREMKHLEMRSHISKYNEYRYEMDEIEEKAQAYLGKYEPVERRMNKRKNKSWLPSYFLPQINQSTRHSSRPNRRLTKQQPIREEIRQVNRKEAYKVGSLDRNQSFYNSAGSSLYFKSVKPKQLTTYQQSEVVNNQAANIKMNQHLALTSKPVGLPTLFKTVQNRQQKKYLGWDTRRAILNSTRTDNYRFYSPVRTGISCVTASSDIPSTLFVLDVWIRSKTQNPYRPPVVKKRGRLYKRVERLLEKTRKPGF